MKTEYTDNNITLKILDNTQSTHILDFYKKNRQCFEQFETAKPENFYSEEFIDKLIQAEYKTYLKGKHIRFFMYDSFFSGHIIGTISFSGINHELRSCIVGYKIDSAYQNAGYGHKMLAMAMRIMINETSMHRFEAYIHPDNTASVSLVKSIGFINEGIAHSYAMIDGHWQDHLRYVYIS